jgi:large subunit ribosomal protein L24
MHIKKGDSVIVLAGKDKGKKGKVVGVFASNSRVLVEGVNVWKKHQKKTRGGGAGQIITRPIHASNVSPVDPKSGKPTRVGSKVAGNKKVRIAKKSGQEI